jgi:Flp pilus assembly protein TadB
VVILAGTSLMIAGKVKSQRPLDSRWLIADHSGSDDHMRSDRLTCGAGKAIQTSKHRKASNLPSLEIRPKRPDFCARFREQEVSAKLARLNRVTTKGDLNTMLWTIFVIFLILWLLGVVTSYTLGGLVHILLVVALVVLVLQLLQGRRSIL